MELELTPEAQELGSNFEKNKGKLPWPVAKGTITEGFGEHPHPVLKNVKTNNNGIDIGCEKGARCSRHLPGRRKQRDRDAGAGKAVVISHGAYRTVYSNLREVSVSKGPKGGNETGRGHRNDRRRRLHGPYRDLEDHVGGRSCESGSLGMDLSRLEPNGIR
ncbi:MAG: hypothetical protein IPP33_16615 [Flavobacteriales bacterium]|nr:hypothetical protein [Flavobacteriales bacterium]